MCKLVISPAVRIVATSRIFLELGDSVTVLPGKEIFINDFKEQLSKSRFWQLVQSDSRRK
jgi:hypothetical protein